MKEDPRFSFTKKDGSPAYFQKLPDNIGEAENMNHHAYLKVMPTIEFSILGHKMSSATDLRNLYQNSEQTERKQIIKELFGVYTEEAKKILDDGLLSGAVDETAGVGLVRSGRDKRYMSSTMGLDNDVTGATLGREMRKFYPTKAPKSKHQRPVNINVGRGS